MLKKGDYFGELALLNDCKRSTTVISADYCTFASIDKEILMNIGEKFLHHMRLHGQEIYDDKIRLERIQFLQLVDYFSDCEDPKDFQTIKQNDELFSLLERLQYHMVEEEYDRGDVIVANGDQCDKIIFILEGKVEIEIHNDDDEECIVIDTLRRGDIIGQYSFII